MDRALAALRPLRDRPRRVLAVFPHPDDEAYGCAGALARSGRDPEAAAVLLCLTRGEASAAAREEGLDEGATARRRVARLERVREIAGLDGLLLPGFPDGRLARCPLDRVAAAVGDVLDVLRPQVVIGHEPRGVNGHSDHVAAHWAIRLALLERRGIRFAMVAYPPETVEAVRPRLLFATPRTEIDASLALSPEEIEAKEGCLRVHDALVTLREDGDPDLLRRPPVEHYDFLDEAWDPPVADLFHGIESLVAGLRGGGA